MVFWLKCQLKQQPLDNLKQKVSACAHIERYMDMYSPGTLCSLGFSSTKWAKMKPAVNANGLYKPKFDKQT